MKNKLIKEIDYIQEIINIEATKFNKDFNDLPLDGFEIVKRFSKIIGLEAEKEHLLPKLKDINLKEAFENPLSQEKKKELNELIKR